ncbi:MAG: Hpt domain-containing protein [Planctomycetes bacterium]|nr:Hpt domain-containing protein [Planctomycetota bacterium]
MTQSHESGQSPIPSDLVREDPALTDLVTRFVNGLSVRLQAMERALRIADFEALSVAAHQLKGSGGGHGYPSLTARAAELEQHARNHAIDDCIDALAELKDLCARIVVREP